MHIASIGIHLGKTTFHLVVLGERNKIPLHKKFSRTQLLAYAANLPVSLIGLEACTGAHFVGMQVVGQECTSVNNPRLGTELVILGTVTADSRNPVTPK